MYVLKKIVVITTYANGHDEITFDATFFNFKITNEPLMEQQWLCF